MATTSVTPTPKKSFLDKLGEWFKDKFDPTAAKVLQVGTVAAEIAAPVIDVAVPGIAGLYNTTLQLAIQAQAVGQQAAASASTGPAKLSAVVSALTPIAIPYLKSLGVSNPTQAQIEAYVNSVVAGLKVFEVVTTPQSSAVPAA